MPEHRLAGIASPQMAAIDGMLQDTSGKVITAGDGSEAPDAGVITQPARYRLKFQASAIGLHLILTRRCLLIAAVRRLPCTPRGPRRQRRDHG
jgi:hypothetical protein